MTYSEPAIYASRDYVTIQTVERPSDVGRWWNPGERFTITIRSPSQNEFFDANRMRLNFSVYCVVPGFNFYPAGGPVLGPKDAPWGNGSGGTPPGANYPQTTQNWSAYTMGLPMCTVTDAASTMPGCPSWGVPFFQSVRVNIPGLSLESFLTTNVESQYMVSSRLLCSAGEGHWDKQAGRIDFNISGEARLAGAKSAYERSSAVSMGGVFSDRAFKPTFGSPGGPSPYVGLVNSRGNALNYSVPLSLFSHIFNGTSNLIPLGFYSTSSDTISLTFELAPVNQAITNVNADRPDVAGPATYAIVDPTISFTKLQISNPSILAAVESLYRGVASVPVAPGMDVPLAFVMKFINYGSATTRINATPTPTSLTTGGAAGAFNLSIPANQPSMRGILVRFAAEGYRNVGLFSYTNALMSVNPGTADGQAWWQTNAANMYTPGQGQWSGRYLLSFLPRLQGFQLRIASYRVPLDPLYDLSYTGGGYTLTTSPGLPAQLQRGQSTNFFSGLGLDRDYGVPVTETGPAPVAGRQPVYTGIMTTDVPLVMREAARLYKLGKHLFSPFATEEDPHDHAMDLFYSVPLTQANNPQSSFFENGPQWLPNVPYLVSLPTAYSGEIVSSQPRMMCGSASTCRYVTNTYGIDGAPKVILPYWTGVGLIIIPFESLPAVYNHRDDAFACRGLDLRSIASMELQGYISGILQSTGAGDIYGVSAPFPKHPQATGTTFRTTLGSFERTLRTITNMCCCPGELTRRRSSPSCRRELQPFRLEVRVRFKRAESPDSTPSR